MRRAVVVFALLLCGSVATPSAAAVMRAEGSQSSLREAPCAHIAWRAGVAERERLIRCAARRWDVPGGYDKAIAVARCESGPNLDPRATYGEHRGIYQHNSSWSERAARYLARWWAKPADVSPYDALANVLVTFQMVTDDDIGWQPWSCA